MRNEMTMPPIVPAALLFHTSLFLTDRFFAFLF